METVYMICAAAGGAILVIQTILLVVGGHSGGDDVQTDGALGGDVHIDVAHDAGLDHAASHHETLTDAQQAAFLKVLSFKTVVAFITFFGLAGLAAGKAQFRPVPTLLLGLGAGFLALYLVAYLMSAMNRLQSRGNVSLANAIGQNGKVYLRIPGQRSGAGKVTVVVQGRSVECKALTDGPEIPTGSEVRITSVIDPSTVCVQCEGKE